MPILPEQRGRRDSASNNGGPKGYVLVVDDEGDIRNLIERFLQGLGYAVLAAGDGEDALFQLVLGHPIRLILCNLRMPRINGPAFYGDVAESCPDLSERFVFCSGDVASDESRRFLLDSGRAWLAKPFELDQLKRTVRRYDDRLPVQLDVRATRRLLASIYEHSFACRPLQCVQVAG